nr:hypothetical protein [uncultured Undibacterium sp.]
MSNKDTLIQLVDAILSPDRPASSLYQEVNVLADLLESIGRYPRHPDDDIAKGETRTEHGLALSPHAAALCAKDFVRTVQFMRGVYQAVCAQNLIDRARPVNLLYVGCGPYALLVLPLMLRLTPQQVQISLIDIHVDSMESVLRIVGQLELHLHIVETTIIDAATYQIDSTRKPDILLLEVMQASLEKEPQLALTRHLMRQVPDALLIPEKIEVSLSLLNPRKEFSLQNVNQPLSSLDRHRIHVGSILCVDGHSIRTWESLGGSHLPAGRLQMPLETQDGYSPKLVTTITVYQDIVIGIYDSGLTYPRSLNVAFRAGDYLNFIYELGASPKLVIEVESSLGSANNT